jgi:uncharacterized protein (DUF2062 family)
MRDWRKNSLRDFLRRLLSLGESPHRTALAFSVGVFLGVSPFWGLHAVIGLALSFIFRLNRFAVLVGVFVNSPWTMAPVASLGTALGFLVMGTRPRAADLAEVSLFSREFWHEMVSDLLWPFFVGNMLLSIIAAVLAYFVFRWILVQNAKRSTH